MKQNSKQSNIVVRGARNSAEFDTMVTNAATAFAHHGVTEDLFRGMLSHSPGYCYSDTRLGIIDGKIAGSVNIMRRKLVIDGCSLPMGAVADVHVKNEFRGRGVAIAILRDSIEYMKMNGLLISLLFSEYHNFYGKLGWQVVPRPMYCLDSSRGAFLVPDRYRVNIIDWKSALKLIFDMSPHSDSEYSGYTLRDKKYRKSMLNWYHLRKPVCFAATEKGKHVAVCTLEETQHGHLSFHECRNLPGHDEAPKNLLLAAINEAEKRKLHTVSACLPETHPVSVKIILLGGRRNFDTDLMVLVPDFQLLMKMMLPLINKRAAGKQMVNGVYQLVCDGTDIAYFSVNNNDVSLIQNRIRADSFEVCNISSNDLAPRILGISTLNGKALTPVSNFFETILQPKNFVFWNADKF